MISVNGAFAHMHTQPMDVIVDCKIIGERDHTHTNASPWTEQKSKRVRERESGEKGLNATNTMYVLFGVK